MLWPQRDLNYTAGSSRNKDHKKSAQEKSPIDKLRSSMWEKIIVKEADLQKLNKTIPEKEEEIVLTKALQAELKANLTRASTCRQIGVVEDAPEEGTLECVVPGKHVLWNGLGKVLLGTSLESSFSFLTLSYMPFDARRPRRRHGLRDDSKHWRRHHECTRQ